MAGIDAGKTLALAEAFPLPSICQSFGPKYSKQPPPHSTQRFVKAAGRRRQAVVSGSPEASVGNPRGSRRRQAQFAELTAERDVPGSGNHRSTTIMPQAELFLRLTLEQTDPRLVNSG